MDDFEDFLDQLDPDFFDAPEEMGEEEARELIDQLPPDFFDSRGMSEEALLNNPNEAE